MLEIVLFLTGVAGAASAAAFRSIPRGGRRLPSIGASPAVRSRMHALEVERDILTKTVSRLYQHDAGLSVIQKDRLLSKYQYRLGEVLAGIDRMEEAGRHPDLGPVGDGLVTLMDQKLSSLDERLCEISSRIAGAQAPEVKGAKRRAAEEAAVPAASKTAPIPRADPADMTRMAGRPIELATLTSVSGGARQFPLYDKPAASAGQVGTSGMDNAQQIQKDAPRIQEGPARIQEKLPHIQQGAMQPQGMPAPAQDAQQIQKDAPAAQGQGGAPETQEPAEEMDDGRELNDLKDQIKRTLERLDQAEVE